MNEDLQCILKTFPELKSSAQQDRNFARICVLQYLAFNRFIKISKYGVFYDPIYNEIVLLEKRGDNSYMVRSYCKKGVKIVFPYKMPKCVQYIGELG